MRRHKKPCRIYNFSYIYPGRYKYYLDANPDKIYFILDQHENPLRKFYLSNPSIIREAAFDETEKFYTYPEGYESIAPAQMNHFHSLIDSYKFFYKLIRNERRSEMAAVEFQSSICNQNLTQQILGKSFDPQSKDELKHCLKK